MIKKEVKMENRTYLAEYMRLSEDDRDIGETKKESNSISNQRKVLQEFISHHQELSGYPVKEFLDDGFSGVNFNRPGIQKLLKEVREGKISCIIVKDLSRFGRNYIEVGDYLEQIFPFMGVRFISVSDQFDSAKQFGGIEIGFKNLLHDLYSRDLSKKIKAVKKIHQERGEYSGGDVPFGYQRNADGEGAYQPDKYAAEIVKMIFGLALEGISPVGIANYLNEQCICPPGVYKNRTQNYNYRIRNQKRPFWFPEKVKEILQNEAYIGTFVCHKSFSVRPKEMEKHEPSEYFRFENDHEALVSNEIFEAAQKVVKTGKKRGHYRKTESIFKGKVKCGYCGYSMNLHQRTKNKFYYCRMGDSCGSRLKIGASVLENTVTELLGKIIAVWEKAEERYKEEKIQYGLKLKKMEEKKRLMEMKLERCKTNRLLLYRQWKEGEIAEGEYREKKEEIEKREKEYLEKKKVLESNMKQIDGEEAEDSGDNYWQNDKGESGLTKEMVEQLITQIDVYGADRVEICWKFKGWE